MKKMVIFEPAMCCSTGVCGPSVNKELLRIATVISKLRSEGILIERHNLTSDPQIFVDNKVINELLAEEGVEILPVTMVDGEIVKTKAYPANEEIEKLLDLPADSLKITIKRPHKSCGCGCDDGCC